MRLKPGRAILALTLGCLAFGRAASADVGRRDFVDTMLSDDPEPGDTLTLGYSLQRFHGDDSGAPFRQHDLGFEVEKRITARLSLSLGSAYSIITAPGAKTQTGFQSLAFGAKYELWRSPAHEFDLSVGLLRGFATGSGRVGADQSGSTTPVVHLGKGLGDLPIGLFRPFAVTGELGYAVADRKLKGRPAPGDDTPGPPSLLFNRGQENRWLGGMSLQYSLSYLDAEVRQLDVPDWLVGLTPLVEVAWSSPASRPSREGTQLLIAPGVIWSSENWQFGVEALVPANRASGRAVGVLAQLKVGLGQIAPALGRRLF